VHDRLNDLDRPVISDLEVPGQHGSGVPGGDRRPGCCVVGKHRSVARHDRFLPVNPYNPQEQRRRLNGIADAGRL
jgi:hypothetical protein